jgi:hypothetical protein
MKTEQFFLVDQNVKKEVINKIIDLECDGKYKISISSAGSKTAKQRALDYLWDSEIFKSGVGWHDESVITTHARSKWLFARPIWLRDDFEVFPIIYNHFMSKYRHDKKKCLIFAQDYISTERFTKEQAWEYMNNKQNFWLEKGVNLTNPNDYGLDFYYKN